MVVRFEFDSYFLAHDMFFSFFDLFDEVHAALALGEHVAGDRARNLETLAAGLTGYVPLIDETAIGIDGELLVATGDRQNTPMGETALGEGNHGDEIAST